MECDRTNRLFDLIRRDPVAGALKCRERAQHDEAGFQRDRLMRIAEAALVIREFRDNYDAWVKFLNDPYFEEEQKLKSHREETYMPSVAWAVMQSTFNPDITNKTKSNRTWKYARAIDFHEIEQLPPEEIADQIERAGGIEKLCRRAAQEDPRREQQAMLATGHKAETMHDDYEDTEDGESEQVAPTLYGYELEAEPELAQRTIWLAPDQLSELESADYGDRVQLTVQCQRGEGKDEIIWRVDSADCIG